MISHLSSHLQLKVRFFHVLTDLVSKLDIFTVSNRTVIKIGGSYTVI